MKIDIIYRTHDGGNRPEAPDKPRKVDVTKREITLGCAYSLSKSIKLCDEEVNIFILDDRSSKKTIKALEKMFGTKIIPYKGDYAGGALNHFTYSKNSDADLIYSLEDDFLHKPEAISELIETYYKFLNNVEPDMICLFPDDDYWDYIPPRILTPTLIVPGIKRSWRMNNHTTNTFFTNPEVLRKYWEPFRLQATESLTNPMVCEETTINVIWKKFVPLFTPLVPLAFHLDSWPALFHEDAIAELWEKNRQ